MFRSCYWLSALLVTLLVTGCRHSGKYIYNAGRVYGTSYHIIYESPRGVDMHRDIDSLFNRYNLIFSTYDSTSVISAINNNRDVDIDTLFLNCFNRAMEISLLSDGAFDITAGPLVNAWGFGPEERKNMTEERIDSLKRITGYQKIEYRDGRFIKEYPEMKLDMSAIAKGYTCDLIAAFLVKQGCRNYMVEIGGEVVAYGKNEKGKVWTIGISKPDDLAFFLGEEIQAKVQLADDALATSGNYQNFYVLDGKRYAHTIDPKSGYPVQHNLLSATVITDNCMDADAFATTFMVIGQEKAVILAESLPELAVYLIYSDDSGDHHIYMTEKFKSYLIK